MISLSHGKLLLKGRRILITRAPHQAGQLASLITAQGGDLFAFPVIMTADPEDWAPIDEAIANLARYRWLVITSPNGAEQFMGRLRTRGRDAGALAGLQVVAVGSGTARALAALGADVDLLPAEFRGAALPAAMAPQLAPGDRILMARGNLADPATAERLRALGHEVDDLVAYRTLLEGGDVDGLKEALVRGEIDYVTFTSSSTVSGLLARLGGREWLEGVRVAVIGPETKKAAEAAGLTVHLQAQPYTLEGLVDAIVEDVIAQGGS